MINRKKLTILASSSVAALALIGVGTGATFTDYGSAEQDISTGTLAVGVYQSDASGNPVTPSDAITVQTHNEVGGHQARIKFDPSKALGSQWTIAHYVTFENIGDLPMRLEKPDVYPSGKSDSPLRNDVKYWIAGDPAFLMNVAWAEDATWYGYVDLAPGEKYTMHFDFKAEDLTNQDMGQSLSPTFQLDAVEQPAVTPLVPEQEGFYTEEQAG